MTLLSIQPGIMGISPYVAGESEIKGVKQVIKLSSNEGALGPSPDAIKAYKNVSHSLHLYPDGNCTELRKAIAKTFSLDIERIICSSGSDEIISLLCQAFAGPGDEVLHTEHGFLMYPISAKACGATPVSAFEVSLTANVDSLLESVTNKTRILFIANPNNPTGTYLPISELQRLRERLRDDILMVIDSAYAEYVSEHDYSAGAAMVEERENVVMTRTFSKIFGLGGIRLGWAYMPPKIIDIMHRIRNPFNVSAAAQAAGTGAVLDLAFTKKAQQHNLKWLSWTREQVKELGLSAPNSVGNFLLLCFDNMPRQTSELADLFLKNEGIIVRGMDNYGLPQSLRITIGTELEMRTVIECLKRFLAQNM
ncbi:MAG: histidinol-phosphate transaminase [Magnetovibrio sp.]|nr:histidinol-phosphate transaminase [Magnetovibrio sp.]|tara:strand:- start:584 stop:1681 length:1098 start_codon:yes stop_codon:yes gene_type:complete